MSLIENLAVGLTVHTNQFASKLKSAAKSVQGFAGSINGFAGSATAKLAGLAAALTGIGSVAALAHFTKNAMEAIDVNAKLSDRLNSTTESLVSLQHAADLSGASAETLNAALDRLQKGIGGGSKGVVEALAAIGLTTEQLRGKGAAEQFRIVAEGIKKLGSEEQRAFIITQLYGKSGQELTATIMAVGDSTKYSEEWTKKLGIAYSRLDAYKVEEANDAWTDTQALLKGVFNQLAIVAAPGISMVLKGMIDFGTEGQGAASLVGNAFNGLISILDTIIGMLGRMNAAARDFGADMIDFSVMIARDFPKATEVMDTAMNYWAGGNAQIDYLNSGGSEGMNLRANQRARELREGANNIRQSSINPIGDFMARANSAAQASANAKAREAAAEKAKMDKMRPYVDMTMKAITAAIPWAKALFSGAGDKIKEDAAYQRAFQSQLAMAFDPRSDLFSEAFMKPAVNPIMSASAGTRGTFAADSASRMSPSYTIQEKQLEVQKDVLKELEDLNQNIENGVPVG